MRRVLITGLVAASWLFAAAPLTVINALITWADGSNPSGTATITWKGSLNNDRSPIFPGKTTITITSGVVSVSLYPNDVALPPAGCYTVDYVLNATKLRKYWYVPTSTSPITDLKQIEGDLPCPAQSGVIVAPSQVTPGAAGQTLVLTSPPNGVPRWLSFGVVPPLVLAPPAGTIIQGFTVSPQSGPTSGNQNQAIDFNSINIISDQANSGSIIANYVKALDIVYHFGGPNMSGPRVGLSSNLILDAPSSPTSTNRDYVPLQGVCTMNSADNGTNTGNGAKGSCLGLNTVSQSAAQNLFGLGGAEFDVGILSPGTVRYRFGVNPVGIYDGFAAGLDGAVVIGTASPGTGAWVNGVVFTDANGQAPLRTTGCAICTDGAVHTIATGIDLSSYNMSTFLKGPGFTISGGSAPTCASTGLGTGSCAVNGGSTNSAGAIVLSPTGAPAGTGSATLTFNGGLGTSIARCSFQYHNGSGGWVTPIPFVIGADSSSAIAVTWNNTVGLVAGSTYLIDYICIGQ